MTTMRSKLRSTSIFFTVEIAGGLKKNFQW